MLYATWSCYIGGKPRQPASGAPERLSRPIPAARVRQPPDR